MKKQVLATLAVIAIVFCFCNAPKQATTSNAPTVYYDTAVSSLIQARCSPCHIPSKGGRKEALDTYASAKEHIDDIIRRVELNPTDPGFMPFKHPKLSESEIAVFRNWRSSGSQQRIK